MSVIEEKESLKFRDGDCNLMEKKPKPIWTGSAIPWLYYGTITERGHLVVVGGWLSAHACKKEFM